MVYRDGEIPTSAVYVDKGIIVEGSKGLEVRLNEPIGTQRTVNAISVAYVNFNDWELDWYVQSRGSMFKMIFGHNIIYFREGFNEEDFSLKNWRYMHPYFSRSERKKEFKKLRNIYQSGRFAGNWYRNNIGNEVTFKRRAR